MIFMHDKNNENKNSEKVKDWLGKFDRVKQEDVDLSRDEDLSIALMNLISLEEHFYFTAMKTSNQKYLDMLLSVRELRKILLKKIVKNPEGEEWCISKHLLGASMRLIETGTKELAKKKVSEANIFFTYAFDLYSLFFAINNKMIGAKPLENIDDPASQSSINQSKSGASDESVESIFNTPFNKTKNAPSSSNNETVLLAQNTAKKFNSSSIKDRTFQRFSTVVKKIVDCCKE